jgi:hypothetical protein
MEKWKSKIRIPTFPPPRIGLRRKEKNGRLHKTLDAPETGGPWHSRTIGNKRRYLAGTYRNNWKDRF